MPFKVARPEDRAGAARSSTSAAASAFYDEGQSASYTTQANAAIQKDLTRHALELLRFGTTTPTTLSKNGDHKETGSTDEELWMLLDLGAGSGLSTLAANEWLLERSLLGFTLAFDISASMLSLTATVDSTSSISSDAMKDNDAVHAAQYDALCMQRAGFYRGNAAQRFPLRDRVFHAAIGISMLQWLTREGLETCFASLHKQLVSDNNTSSSNNNSGGRAVFQVYPPTLEYVELMEQTARQMGFAYAEVFVSFPHATTAKKWFFCIEKTTSQQEDSGHHHTEVAAGSLCLFGRRFHRRCAWHLLQSSSQRDQDSIVTELRDRLGREHVKTVWHIWRKYRRSLVVASQQQAAVVHAKAKRSLELWKSDEVIGKALQTRFLPEPQDQTEETAKTVTYDLFLSHMGEVVDILHAAYTEAVEIERALQSEA